MELHQLRYFCAIARSGSFTRAAEEERIAQPSLSQQIQKLEIEVGAPLLLRLGRSVQLTEFGEAFLPKAKTVLRELEEARRAIDNLQDDVRGKLIVGAIPTVMPYFLASRVVGFATQFPNVELLLKEDITPRLIERLQAGELDVVVASLSIYNPDLLWSELFRDPMCLAVAPTHPLASATVAEWPALRTERLLILKEGHCFRDQVLTAGTRRGAYAQAIFESDQFSSIFPLVASGFGVSIIPEMAAPLATGCRVVPLGPASVRRVGYFRNRRCFSSKAAKAFVSWLRSVAQEQAKNPFVPAPKNLSQRARCRPTSVPSRI
jgi:LysR family transcriptional regulator, hydrogen peroxide-inducible genes activator